MPLTLHSIVSADEAQRPERPDQRHDMAGESGGNGMRHGTPPLAVPSTPVQSDESLPPVYVHQNVIVPTIVATENSTSPDKRATVNSPYNVAFCERQPAEIGCGENLLPPSAPEHSGCGNLGITHGETVDAAGIGCSTRTDTSAIGIDSGDATVAEARGGVNPRGDRASGGAAATERTVAVTCRACLGRGSSAHVLTRQCSVCNGIGSLAIAIAPDCTGIAPNWARWQAVLAEEYDGAATGRAGAVGCGQTQDEAIADLLERLEG